MVFSSLVFLYLFLPITLLLHFLAPKKRRNAVLLLMNLIFYGYGEPVFVLLMLVSIAVNFLLGLLIDTAKGEILKKLYLVLTVAINLMALGWFKYAGLFADALRSIPGFSGVPLISVVLPIGISFYTFQALSYVVDVYRGDCVATRNIIDFAAYISLFPQLIAGPIVRYCDVDAQLKERTVTAEKFGWGVKIFCVGLAKKVLLANQFALLWEQVSPAVAEMGTVWSWLAIAGYTLQIYFDFGGYSDMARGLGAMFGFDFCINFDYPYIAKGITEFWRRWHISLSSWFRDYVYIPLGGNRKGTGRTVFNILVVWMLTGFWHGAGWNFLLWGLYYGLLLLIEKFLLSHFLCRLPALLQRAYTLFFVMIGWVFFACPDWSACIEYLRVMFAFKSGASVTMTLSWLPIGIVGAFAATPCMKALWDKIRSKPFVPYLETALCLAALLLCTASLVSGSYNPFLYFRF